MHSYARRWLSNVARLHLQQPEGLVQATAQEVRAVVPHSYEISEYRHRTFESRKMMVKFKGDAHSTPGASMSPDASYIEIVYPFSTNHILRDQYERFRHGKIRYGLLLEDLDCLAGDIAARHAGTQDKAVVTGCVDRIAWFGKEIQGSLSIQQDLRMAGQVTWVGRSAMEVLIELESRQAEGGWLHVGLARFVMLARNKAMTAAMQVPRLQPQTPNDLALLQQGQMHDTLRKQKREQQQQLKPTSSHEVDLMQHVLRQQAQSQAAGGSTGCTAVPMRTTEQQYVCLMHLQDRNTNAFVFGGHLLRLAFELAYGTAAMHAGCWCEAVSMDDVNFMEPVPVGCVLQFKAKVVFVEGPVIRVRVTATRVDPGVFDREVTNDVSIAFVVPDGQSAKGVYPESLSEFLDYLQGHRHHAESVREEREVLGEQAGQVMPAVADTMPKL